MPRYLRHEISVWSKEAVSNIRFSSFIGSAETPQLSILVVPYGSHRFLVSDQDGLQVYEVALRTERNLNTVLVFEYLMGVGGGACGGVCGWGFL